MDKKNPPSPVEMETFLPKDGSSNGIRNGKYQVTPTKDPEAADPIFNGEYDPFRERKLDNPTTDCDTLTHLLKSALGTGILAMPKAFQNIGLILGIFATMFVALVCTHCAYVLVKCGHELYRRCKVTALGFADIAEISCKEGPEWSKKYATPLRYIIQISLFATYFGTCSVYTVIVAKNFEQVISHYTGVDLDQRCYIAMLLLPLIFLSWVPNLKYLAPVSMIANLFMAAGLGITFYYLVMGLQSIDSVNYVGPIVEWPSFFSLTIFAMEGIGVVMPLENNMKTPQHFVGICGVLNRGMSGIALIYILLGFLGYLRYGAETRDVVTLNLPTEEIAAQAVKILIALAVFCTYALQFYVCLDIAWNGIKDRFVKRPMVANYILRTVLAIASVLIAIAVPTIAPFIGLIGAFCFSILGLLVPVFIEIVVFWDGGLGKGYWRVWKNALVFIFGLFALFFGSWSAISEIVKIYVS